MPRFDYKRLNCRLMDLNIKFFNYININSIDMRNCVEKVNFGSTALYNFLFKTETSQ
jgi:hypothetical protein